MSHSLLCEAFRAIQFKGTYGVTETIETYKLPRINVKGVGRLSFPINEYQIEKLKNVMEKPFELGEKSEFKKPLCIDTNNIEMDNSFGFLLNIIPFQLGLEGCNITARFNRLELYEEGGGYHWHQDKKKSKENFGSLVIHLPSYYEGGEFSIKHDRTIIKNKYNQQEGEDRFFYSAYYSDCYHKLDTITKGNRIMIFFDLILKDFSKEPNLSIINANWEAKNKLEHFIRTIHVNTDHIVDNKPRFIFPLDHSYCGSNRSLKGEDRAKLSLLQNMRDENGNDLFFICLGTKERRVSGWDKTKTLKITSLPHSLFNKPPNFRIKLTDEEAKIISKSSHKRKYDSIRHNYESVYKENFALIWLTDHHFSIVSSWYDFTNDMYELVKSNPTYGKKYIDELINQGNNIGNAKSTLLLRDKDRFLNAIACEPPSDTKTFYKIISDSIKNELVTWDEVISQIARFMGKFDLNQVDFFSNIKDSNIKLKFFNEIKKSAKFESTGLYNWLNVHKEVNCNIDYIFKNFDQKDAASNIKLFIYCFNHQLLQKSLEYATYFCKHTAIFDSIFASTAYSDSFFYNEIVLNFIKLNDDECLRNFTEYLFSPVNVVRTTEITCDIIQNLVHFSRCPKKDSVWQFATQNVKKSSKLIPYIFDFLEQKPTFEIKQEILFAIFDLIVACDKEKVFVVPRQYYILLFNRVKLDNFLEDKNKKRVEKIIQHGDESIHKSFAIKVFSYHNYDKWNKVLKSCKLTQSFSNILCDNFLRASVQSSVTFAEMGSMLISYIDNNRLKSLFLFACSLDVIALLLISITIINEGRENDCNLCSILADFLIKKGISKDTPTIFPILLRIIRNDNVGAKFLHNIDIRIDDSADLLQKKFDLVDNLLFESDLNLQSNILSYSSGFLFRIKSLISFEIDYFKTKKLAPSWIYPDDLLLQTQEQTLREGILEFLKQDIQAADFGMGALTGVIQARKEAAFLKKIIPHIHVIAFGRANTAYYTIRKKTSFPDPDKTNKKLEQLTSMLTYITSNCDEQNNFGLPTISTRAPCVDESPRKQTKINK